jgi:hypothetical protein
MPDDDILKDVMLQIIAYCEKLFLERSVLERIAATSGDRDWHQRYESALSDPEIRSAIHQKFEFAYELVERLVAHDRDEKALRELMQKLPSSKLIH